MPGIEKSWGGLINVYKYLMGGSKEDRAKLFSAAAQPETQEVPFEHQETLFKFYFTVKVTDHKTQLHRQVVESPSF